MRLIALRPVRGDCPIGLDSVFDNSAALKMEDKNEWSETDSIRIHSRSGGISGFQQQCSHAE
jgi:hypothetical protein